MTINAEYVKKNNVTEEQLQKWLAMSNVELFEEFEEIPEFDVEETTLYNPLQCISNKQITSLMMPDDCTGCIAKRKPSKKAEY